VAIIFSGYRQPTASVSNVNVENTNLSDNLRKVSVDDVMASGVASILASATSLPVAPDVSSLAISAETQFQFEQSNSVTSAKPQIVDTVVSNRSIVRYVVKEGDTIDSIAANFKISVNTIKWANNLIYNSLSVGKELRILPIDGTAYTVKSGDSVDSIAEKYKIDKTRLVVYNDLDVSGLIVGNEIILPNSILPEQEQPGYVSQIVNYSFVSNGNTYSYGYCTWYVYNRRMELGSPVSSNLGNAYTWSIITNTIDNHNPTVGSVVVMKDVSYYGHVGVVEKIEDNGDIVISEMNYIGWNVMNTRTISAGQAALYSYIP
jgi:surface antigen